MGMTMTLLINPKCNGRPFHTLEPTEQALFEDYEYDVLLQADGDWNVLRLLQEEAEVVIDNKEAGELYLSIDREQIEGVVKRFQRKIDEVLETLDPYDEFTYGENGEPARYARIVSALRLFQNDYTFDEHYVVVQAGW